MLNQLRRMNDIVNEAEEYYERADDLKMQAINDKKRMESIKFILVLATVVLCALFALGTYWNLIYAACIVCFIICYVLTMRDKKNFLELLKKANEEDEKGYRFLYNHRQELYPLSEKYWFPLATDYLIEMAETGRATNINQALDLLDTYIHRLNVENANNLFLREQEHQTELMNQMKEKLDQIEINTFFD